MRTRNGPSTAYQVPHFGSPFGVWPRAGFSSIAYRLAELRVPRIGAVLLASMVFYLA
jgi:hypothetical protein